MKWSPPSICSTVALDHGACLARRGLRGARARHGRGRTSSDPARIDDKGNPVPSCAQVTDPAITDATMYNFQECGETKKASLAPDDIAAVCSVYPVAKDPEECERVTNESGCGGCAAGATTTG